MQIANALSPEATGDRHQIVRLFWDKNKCKLLGDGVVLMDTPGLDIDENYDMWIDKYCMDADVFVLVANGESTLKQTVCCSSSLSRSLVCMCAPSPLLHFGALGFASVHALSL